MLRKMCSNTVVLLTSWIRDDLPLLTIRATGEVEGKHHSSVGNSSSQKGILDHLSTLKADSVRNTIRTVLPDVCSKLNLRYSSKEKDHAKL